MHAVLRRLALVLVALVTTGAGCDGRVDLRLTVHDTGGGTLEVVAVLDAEAQALTGVVDLDARAVELMPDAWTVLPTAVAGRRGVRMTRRFTDAADLSAAAGELDAASRAAGLGPGPRLALDRSPDEPVTRLEVTVPELALVPGPDSPGAGISADLGGPGAAEARQLTVSARLPGRFTETDGGDVSDGRVTWVLSGGEPHELVAVSDTRTPVPAAAVATGVVGAALVLGLVLRRWRRSAGRQPAMR